MEDKEKRNQDIFWSRLQNEKTFQELADKYGISPAQTRLIFLNQKGDFLKKIKRAEKNGVRYRVFCASLADVFDNKIDPKWRADLWELIWKTPNLDWLLLTKRPQNIEKMLPNVFDVGRKYEVWGKGWKNVWLGTTVEDQKRVEQNIPELLKIPAYIRFLSCEPLLEKIDLNKIPEKDKKFWPGNIIWHPMFPRKISYGESGIHWVITGGESGNNFRPADPDWFRSLRDQCVAAGVPFFFKQWDGKSQKEIKEKGSELDGVTWKEFPDAT